MASPLPPPPSDAVPGPPPGAEAGAPSSRRPAVVAAGLVGLLVVVAAGVFVMTRGGGGGGDESAGGWNTIVRLDDSDVMTLLDPDGDEVDTVELGRSGLDLRTLHTAGPWVVLYDSSAEELVVVDTAAGDVAEHPVADDSLSVRPVAGSDVVVFAGSSQGGPEGVFVNIETGESIDLTEIGAADDALYLDTTARAGPAGDTVAITDQRRTSETTVISFDAPTERVTVPGFAVSVTDDRVITNVSSGDDLGIVYHDLDGAEVHAVDVAETVAAGPFDDGSLLALGADGTIRRVTEGSDEPEDVGSLDVDIDGVRAGFSANGGTRFVVLTETAIVVIDRDGRTVGVIEGNDSSVQGRVTGRCILSGRDPFVVVDTEEATVLEDGEGAELGPARQGTPDGCVVVIESPDGSALAGRVSAPVDGRVLALAPDAAAVIVGGDEEQPVRLVEVTDDAAIAADDGIEIGPRRANYVFVDR